MTNSISRAGLARVAGDLALCRAAVLGCVACLCCVAGGVLAEDWPQWRGPGRDGVWSETGIVERFEQDRLPLKWSTPIASGYSGPTVSQGRVFVMDRLTEPMQQERVLALDEGTGKILWTHVYDCVYSNVDYTAGPRASVSIDGQRCFALGTMGHLHCLSTEGELIWKRDLNAEYRIRMPIWGIAPSPLVYGDKLILQIGGADGACVVALDKASGREIWKALDDQASYSAPIVIQHAGRDVLIVWTGDHVAGLDPGTGGILWKHPFTPTRMVIGIATPAYDHDRILVSSFYDGSLLLRLGKTATEVESVWRRLGPDEQHTESLHSIISTPVLTGDFIYGVDSYGELRCLDANTGDRLWQDESAVPRVRWGTIHFVKNGDRYFLFNERGELAIAHLTPQGYQEISRTKLIDPTPIQLNRRDGVCWSHPAFANRHVFARNDKEIVCASLEAR